MGGYQASLYEIGRTYDLSITNMGFFAAAELNADWRLLFLLIAIGSVVAAAGVFLFRNEEREQTAETDEDKVKNGLFVISGVLLLCAVMFIYVGFENGFAFFIDTIPGENKM